MYSDTHAGIIGATQKVVYQLTNHTLREGKVVIVREDG
jgi:hypothetical protein